MDPAALAFGVCFAVVGLGATGFYLLRGRRTDETQEQWQLRLGHRMFNLILLALVFPIAVGLVVLLVLGIRALA